MEQSGNLERIESEEMERTIIIAVDGGVSLDRSDSVGEKGGEALMYSSSKKSDNSPQPRDSTIVDKLNEAIKSKAYISGVGVKMSQVHNLKPPIDPLKKLAGTDPKKNAKLSKYQQSREKMKKKKLSKKVQELAQHIQ